MISNWKEVTRVKQSSLSATHQKCVGETTHSYPRTKYIIFSVCVISGADLILPKNWIRVSAVRCRLCSILWLKIKFDFNWTAFV